MHAVLILSQSPVGIRQTVIAKTPDNVRSFTRVGFARGLGATWSEFDQLPTSIVNELVLDSPKAIAMTPAHMRDVNFTGRTPNNVLQAILKNVPQVGLLASGPTLSGMYSEMLWRIEHDPVALASYMNSMSVTPVTPEPEVDTEPVTLAVLFDRERASEPDPAPTQTTAEPAMALATTVAEAVHDSDTVKELASLTVPAPFDYVERKFQGVTESTIYDKSMAFQWNVLLLGDAGTGKTSSARNLAARRQVPFVVVECNQQIDITVTQGRFVPGSDGKSLKWVYSQLVTAIQQPSVVLLNEVTRMNPKSASLFLRLLEERELAIDTFNEVIKVHPECILIGDANIGGMYNGTTRADAAFTDRFGVKLTFSYDTDLEQKFLPYPALLGFAKAIRTASDLGQQDFSVPMSTRLLKSFVAQSSAFGWDFAVERLLASFPSESGERNAIKTRLEADAPAIQSELNITN
jgi:MoxR-like ATPase